MAYHGTVKRSSTCPCCGQPMPVERCGVRLTKLKARLFDVVARAAETGITEGALRSIVWEGTAAKSTIKAHIWQINDALSDQGVRIQSIDRRYYLKEIPLEV